MTKVGEKTLSFERKVLRRIFVYHTTMFLLKKLAQRRIKKYI